MGCLQELEVQYQEPSNVELFDRHDLEGITVYVAHNVKAVDNRLTLTVKRALFFGKTAEIKGVELKL